MAPSSAFDLLPEPLTDVHGADAGVVGEQLEPGAIRGRTGVHDRPGHRQFRRGQVYDPDLSFWDTVAAGAL